jgi:hypothetical protein
MQVLEHFVDAALRGWACSSDSLLSSGRADLFAGRVLTFRMRDLSRNPLRAVEWGSRLHQGDFKALIGVRPT